MRRLQTTITASAPLRGIIVDAHVSKFSFLLGKDDELADLLTKAEALAASEVQLSCLKTRTFYEKLVKKVGTAFDMPAQEKESNFDHLKRLRDSNIIPRDIASCIHEIRKIANPIVHEEKVGSPFEAFRCLSLAYPVAEWFTKTTLPQGPALRAEQSRSDDTRWDTRRSPVVAQEGVFSVGKVAAWFGGGLAVLVCLSTCHLATSPVVEPRLPTSTATLDIGEGSVPYILEPNTVVTVHFSGDVDEIKTTASRGAFEIYRIDGVMTQSCTDTHVSGRGANRAFLIKACKAPSVAELEFEGVNTIKPVYDNRTISPNERDTATLTANTTLNIELIDGANQLTVNAIRGSFNIFGSEGNKLNMFCTSSYTARATSKGKGYIRACGDGALIEMRGTYIAPPPQHPPQPAIVFESQPRVQPHQPYYPPQNDRSRVYSRPGVDGNHVVIRPGVGQ